MNGFERVVVRSITPAVEATPDYSSDDVVGGLHSIVDACRNGTQTGTLLFFSMSLKADITPAFRVLLFKSNPSSTTFTENSALSLNAADYDKVLAFFDISSADDADLGTPHIMTKNNLNIPFHLTSGTTLYAVLLARATLNLGSTSDITMNFGILQD